MLLLLGAATALRLGRAPSPRMVGGGAAGTAAGGGGDLSGGNDEQRNKQVASLRARFNAPDAEDVPAEEAVEAAAEKVAAQKLGLLLDLPLCRYSWCLLPGHQVAMSVWQPQYTLMFNRLLSEPGPHYYLHVLMPGGAESLGEPGYELEPGSKASLMGTLCRVAVGQRNADSTLTLVVQGLGRGVVLRPTQMLPYSRGDVQLLPDCEALLAGALASERVLGTAAVAAPARAVKRRLVAAAAAAELEAHLPYEAVKVSVDAGGHLAPLNQLNVSAAAAVIAAAAPAVEEAIRGTLSSLDGSGGPLYEGSAALRLLDGAVEAAERVAAGGEEAAADIGAEMLEGLEERVWTELDGLLRDIEGQRGPVPVPSQLLGLMPPAPEAGWPDSFRLGVSAARLSLEYRLRAKGEEELSYVPVDAAYPARRRAERLSWAIWAIIGNQTVGVNAYGGSPYQEVIEADGTAERLRLALARLVDIRREIGV